MLTNASSLSYIALENQPCYEDPSRTMLELLAKWLAFSEVASDTSLSAQIWHQFWRQACLCHLLSSSWRCHSLWFFQTFPWLSSHFCIFPDHSNSLTFCSFPWPVGTLLYALGFAKLCHYRKLRVSKKSMKILRDVWSIKQKSKGDYFSWASCMKWWDCHSSIASIIIAKGFEKYSILLLIAGNKLYLLQALR